MTARRSLRRWSRDAGGARAAPRAPSCSAPARPARGRTQRAHLPGASAARLAAGAERAAVMLAVRAAIGSAARSSRPYSRARTTSTTTCPRATDQPYEQPWSRAECWSRDGEGKKAARSCAPMGGRRRQETAPGSWRGRPDARARRDRIVGEPTALGYEAATTQALGEVLMALGGTTATSSKAVPLRRK